MTDTHDVVLQLPFDRSGVLHVSPVYGHLRETTPVVRVTTPTGVQPPTRQAKPHLAFGHGAHFCIGQNLARTELRIVFPSLFTRFPAVRLAVDVNELQVTNDRTGGGVEHLPVTW